jgi:hypothetical protein
MALFEFQSITEYFSTSMFIHGFIHLENSNFKINWERLLLLDLKIHHSFDLALSLLKCIMTVANTWTESESWIIETI